MEHNKKKRGLAEMLDVNSTKVETKESKNFNLPAILFKAQADTHITHLLQKDKTLATHMALKEFYDPLHDMMDVFIETYMGVYPLEEIVVPSCENIENPKEYLTQLYELISIERKKISEGYLLNQIDELHQLIAHTLYKLKYITT